MNALPRTAVILLTLLAGIALGTVAGMRIAAVPAAAQPTAPTAQLEFAIEGKPIHPAVVQTLMCSLAASAPFVRAIDVAAFDDADAYELTTTLGYATAHRLDDHHARTGERISYNHVGILQEGVHVLDVSESGGGSGVFRSLLLVRLEEITPHRLMAGHQRTLIMSSVDQIALGDRNDARASVQGDAVVIEGRLEGDLAGLGAGRDRVVLKLR